ncbi:MAG: hypothetical protein L0170_15040 [Acidobacteria bacterium]|nr:hypothetical protein [Acidobacteriota bacterium]
MVAPIGAASEGLLTGFQAIAQLYQRGAALNEERRQFDLALQLRKADMEHRLNEDRLQAGRQEREMARLEQLAQLQQGQFQLQVIDQQRKLKGANAFGVDTSEEEGALRGLPGLSPSSGGSVEEQGSAPPAGEQKTPGLGFRPGAELGRSPQQGRAAGGLLQGDVPGGEQGRAALGEEPQIGDQEIEPWYRFGSTAGEGDKQTFGGVTYIATEAGPQEVAQMNENLTRQAQMAAQEFDSPQIATPRTQYVSIPGSRMAVRALRNQQVDAIRKAREDVITTTAQDPAFDLATTSEELLPFNEELEEMGSMTRFVAGRDEQTGEVNRIGALGLNPMNVGRVLSLVKANPRLAQSRQLMKSVSQAISQDPTFQQLIDPTLNQNAIVQEGPDTVRVTFDPFTTDRARDQMVTNLYRLKTELDGVNEPLVVARPGPDGQPVAKRVLIDRPKPAELLSRFAQKVEQVGTFGVARTQEGREIIQKFGPGGRSASQKRTELETLAQQLERGLLATRPEDRAAAATAWFGRGDVERYARLVPGVQRPAILEGGDQRVGVRQGSDLSRVLSTETIQRLDRAFGKQLPSGAPAPPSIEEPKGLPPSPPPTLRSTSQALGGGIPGSLGGLATLAAGAATMGGLPSGPETAPEDLRSAQTAIGNVAKAAAGNRNTVAKTSAETVKTEWSDMTADEKKTFKSTWTQTKPKWVNWKIDAATIKSIDDLVAGKALEDETSGGGGTGGIVGLLTMASLGAVGSPGGGAPPRQDMGPALKQGTEEGRPVKRNERAVKTLAELDHYLENASAAEIDKVKQEWKAFREENLRVGDQSFVKRVDKILGDPLSTAEDMPRESERLDLPGRSSREAFQGMDQEVEKMVAPKDAKLTRRGATAFSIVDDLAKGGQADEVSEASLDDLSEEAEHLKPDELKRLLVEWRNRYSRLPESDRAAYKKVGRVLYGHYRSK